MHHNATYEQILLCLAVFCIEETTNRTLPLGWYSILKEHDITETMCRTVLRNLLKYYRQNQPLCKNTTTSKPGAPYSNSQYYR